MENNIKEIILEMYNSGIDGRKIANQLDLKVQKVYYTLQRMGYVSRNHSTVKQKHIFDETFLEKIDCEWKAYFLGFLYADGNLYRNTINLHISEKDKYILDEFNRLIYDGKRHLKEIKPYKSTKRSYALLIDNKKCALDIQRLGIIPKKSLILKYPTYDQVPESLIHHFIRGYFDGDGCITKTKYNGRVIITSSLHFCEGLQTFLESKLDAKSYINRNDNIYVLSINSKKDIKSFYNFIYKDSSPNLRLGRKHDLFTSIIDGI